MAKRIIRESYGIAATIPQCKPGAMAQCAFCEWSRFFAESKRKRRRAIYRAAAALQGHARKMHADRLPKFEAVEFGPSCGSTCETARAGPGVS